MDTGTKDRAEDQAEHDAKAETDSTPAYFTGTPPCVPPTTMTIVLDTNVVLDWLIFRDREVRFLGAAIEERRVRVLTRTDCRDELIRVLNYPELKQRPDSQAVLLARYDAFAELITVPAVDRALPVCRDPDDQKFMELARDTGARCLITKDKMLLALVHQVARTEQFSILSPQDATRDFEWRESSL